MAEQGKPLARQHSQPKGSSCTYDFEPNYTSLDKYGTDIASQDEKRRISDNQDHRCK